MSVQPSTFDFVLRQPVLLIGAEPLARRRLEGILLQFGYEPESLCSAGSMAEAGQLLPAARVRGAGGS